MNCDSHNEFSHILIIEGVLSWVRFPADSLGSKSDFRCLFYPFGYETLNRDLSTSKNRWLKLRRSIFSHRSLSPLFHGRCILAYRTWFAIQGPVLCWISLGIVRFRIRFSQASLMTSERPIFLAFRMIPRFHLSVLYTEHTKWPHASKKGSFLSLSHSILSSTVSRTYGFIGPRSFIPKTTTISAHDIRVILLVVYAISLSRL